MVKFQIETSKLDFENLNSFTCSILANKIKNYHCNFFKYSGIFFIYYLHFIYFCTSDLNRE